MIDSHKNKSALEGSLEILHLSCNCTKLVNSEHDHAASGSVVMVAAPLQPQSAGVGKLGMGINA